MAGNGPTVAGFLDFVRNTMGITATVLPDASPFIQTAFDLAMNIVLPGLACVPSQPTSPSIYAIAVYNFGGDALINIAPDQVGQTYFTKLRESLNLNSFVGGVISSGGDEGTNESMVVPDFAKYLTMMNLQQLKTPWGRAYMAIAQSYGYIVGLTC